MFRPLNRHTPLSGKPAYKWLILLLCFLMVFICLGFCSSNKGLYLSAITEAFDIKRSLFSINDSCRFIATAVVNLFFGSLISRFGARKLIAAGFLCLIASSLLYAYAETMPVFYIGGCFLGVGLAWTTTTMVSLVINKWFHKNRGTVMGFVLAANGLGGALAAQIISPVIYEKGNAFGYRNAYLLTAAVLLAAGVVIVLFLRESPAVAEEETDVPEKRGRGQAWEGLPFGQVAKRPYFIVAAVCVLLTGLSLQSVTGVAAAHMRDVGFDAAFIANALSIHSLMLALFKFLTGILYDKLGLRVTMMICSAAAVVNIFLLSALTDSSAGRVLAMVYSIFIALALPLETIIIPFIASDLFGERSFAKALGILISINTAGYAVGGPLCNYVYDSCGSYRPILIILSGVMALIAVCIQFVLAKAQKVRRAAEAAALSPGRA